MPQDKTRSLRALDALNFCNAGIQTGLGPFMSIYYTAVRHWHPGQIGILIACQSLAGILVQPVVGHWVDESQNKRIITAAAALLVASGAVCIAVIPSYALQILVQLVIGLAVTVFPAATAAFALGMAENDQVSGRVSRNESYTHTGNVFFAVAAGAIGTLLALSGIFYAAGVFAAGMAAAVVFIKKDDVSHESARQGGDGDPKPFRELIKDKRILAFTAAVVLFNVSNMATLPLVGEILSKGQKGSTGHAAWQISAAVIVAEAVMIGVAALAGKQADKRGRKPLFLIAFAFLALRNALTVISHNPAYLISLQALDGVAAGAYGVLLTLVTKDLASGTGRFNFLQGMIQSAMGMGGFLSNALFGWVAKAAGFNVSFWGLSAVAVLGGLFYQLRMPETAGELNSEESKSESQPSQQPEGSHMPV